jgi:RHS repeat-associated protein
VIVTNSSEEVLVEAHFTYDVNNNLIIREIDADGDGPNDAEILATVYHGVHPWADFNATGELQNRYIYGQAVDQILARVDAEGEVDWYLTDNLGSVRQIVDADGDILDEIDYDSFGNILSETTPAAGDRFKFTAREWEAAIDLQFSRARWYDPNEGRFTSEDPVSFAAGDLNLTRYVGNRTIDHIDPFGNFIFPLSPRELINEADRRRGNGPLGDSAQHCWAACWVAAKLGPGMGTLAAILADLGETELTADTVQDIAAQHYGAGAPLLFFPFSVCFASTFCDKACGTWPD